MKTILDEIFGKDNFRNEIIWAYTGPGSPGMKQFNRKHDNIFWYSKSNNWIFNSDEIRVPSEVHSGGFGTGMNNNESSDYENKGKIPEDWWEFAVAARLRVDGIQRTGYPTEKPNKFLERIIKTSSKEGDLIADFFCGSGSLLYNAEKLGRKWIGTDLGKFGIHTTRKRMIGVQRELKKENKDFRAFEILNLGRYERENFISVNGNLRDEEKSKQLEVKEKEFVRLILTAYKAEPVETFKNFVGKKRDRLVAIGPINMPISSRFIDYILEECTIYSITKVDVLGFDYEMGLDIDRAKEFGVDISFKKIPKEVFDKKAVERGQVKFYDLSFLEAKPIISGKGNEKELSIGLSDFSVFYNQDDSGEIVEALRPGGSKVIVENGQVVKISKAKDGTMNEPEILTKKWSDWVDYWAVDFDFSSRKEMVRVPKTHGGDLFEKGKVQDLLEYEDVWTGDYIFDNEWQSFRTKKNRNLELTSASKVMPKGTYKVAVKVVDIFGNDTTKVIEVKI
jgi:hypothetical protein